MNNPDSAASSLDADVRERVLHAAQKCFEKWGVDRTRVEDIAKAAQISRPNLYNYFPSKQDLFRECLIYLAEDYDRYFNDTLPIKGPARTLIIERFARGVERCYEIGFFPTMLANSGESAQRVLASATSSITEVELRYWRKLWAYAEATGELRRNIDREDTLRRVLQLQAMTVANFHIAPGFPEDLRGFANTFVATAMLADQRN